MRALFFKCRVFCVNQMIYKTKQRKIGFYLESVTKIEYVGL